MRGTLVVVIVLSSATTAVAYHQSASMEDWDLVSACLVDVVDGDDVLCFAPTWVGVALGDDDGLAAVSRPMDVDARASVPTLVAGHESVWLVVHHTADADDVATVLTALDGSYAPTVSWVDDSVHVVRYDRSDITDAEVTAASAARNVVPFAMQGFEGCSAVSA